MPKWAKIWSKRSNISKPHPPGWSKVLFQFSPPSCAWGSIKWLLHSVHSSAGAISIGWLWQCRHSWWELLAGSWSCSRQATSSSRQLCCQWILLYLGVNNVVTVMLNFVYTWFCSRALDWSVEAACQAEAWFLVTQTIITHFYVITTSLLRVMTVIMALLLHIFITSLLHINTPYITSLLP